MSEWKITDVYAREILDSRGNPTVEAEVTVENEYVGRAAVPSGASTGRFEAVELRDGEKRYLGLGVHKAVQNVNTKLREALIGQDVTKQSQIDKILIETDGTQNKSSIGANATLAVSMACARAAADALRIPLFRYLGGVSGTTMPMPMMNIMNGGVHADNSIDIQEFMIVPIGADSFHTGLQMCVEIYQKLKTMCKDRGLTTAVGDEGGFAPNLENATAVLQLITEAVQAAGYRPGQDICYAIDVAASELYREEKEMYYFPGESKMQGEEIFRDSHEMVSYFEEMVNLFPIVSIEDALHEDDWDSWQMLTKRLGKKVQLVGDDLFVTNIKRLEAGIKLQTANAILIKVNQIGTLSEALEAVRLAQTSSYRTVISHRSGETEDSFIADLAVACNAGQIKTGAPCRSDRNAKYNQLLRIEEKLDADRNFAHPF